MAICRVPPLPPSHRRVSFAAQRTRAPKASATRAHVDSDVASNSAAAVDLDEPARKRAAAAAAAAKKKRNVERRDAEAKLVDEARPWYDKAEENEQRAIEVIKTYQVARIWSLGEIGFVYAALKRLSKPSLPTRLVGARMHADWGRVVSTGERSEQSTLGY